MRPDHCLPRALPCLLLLFTPAMAQAQMRFEGAGQETALDCDGGTIHVAGAGNRLTIGGACSELQVEGADNQIRIDLAPRAGISIQGAGNSIGWHAPSAAKPRISSTGVNNRIYRLK